MTQTTHYLYRTHPARLAAITEGPTAEEVAIVTEHFNWLKGLADKGIVILVGRTMNNDPTAFGLAIFKAASLEEAQALMSDDPGVKKGVQLAELFPFQIAILNENNA